MKSWRPIGHKAYLRHLRDKGGALEPTLLRQAPLFGSRSWLLQTAQFVEQAKVPLVSLLDGPLVASRDLLLDLARLTPRGSFSMVRRNWNFWDRLMVSDASYKRHLHEDPWLHRSPQLWSSFPEPERLASFSFLTFTGADFVSVARSVEASKDAGVWVRTALQKKLEPNFLISGFCESRLFIP